MATLDQRGEADGIEGAPAVAEAGPSLYDGQRLDQPAFHELYLKTPERFRAELIDGVVHVMSSPVSSGHGRPYLGVGWFLYSYAIETLGTVPQGDTTTKLGPKSEVQPDCALLIEPSSGGQTGEDEKGYTTGCPELIVEISSSTLSVDLKAKKRVYEEAGALEYVVFDEPHRKFHWFLLREGRFEPMPIDPDGLYRSRAFPGLWLDAAAFLSGDHRAVVAALRRGLDSPEHAEFVDRLRRHRAVRP